MAERREPKNDGTGGGSEPPDPGAQLPMHGRIRHSESLRLRLENSIAMSPHSPPIMMRNEILFFSPDFFPETSLSSEKASRNTRK